MVPSSLKQVGMGSGALKHDAIRLDFIDQQPVGFDVAFPSPFPVADQLMIPMDGIQGVFGDQRTYEYFQLIEVLPRFCISLVSLSN